LSRANRQLIMNRSESITRMASDQEALERIVMHAFDLHPVFRRAFLLCDIQGFTVGEAAAILGISSDAVAKRLDRARRELKVRLAAAT
jgi:DNA-directed RNA polymerase specialized sigma24 family protein